MADLSLIAEARGPKSGNVVLFHGLGGDPLETWTSPPPENAVWPEWLAKHIEGHAVYSIRYDAPVSDTVSAVL